MDEGGGRVSSQGADVAAVASRLGRVPAGDFVVVARDGLGLPAVIANAPLLRDGTPMPTRYWLVHPGLCAAVARLESSGAIRAAEAEIDPAALRRAHRRYERERISLLPPGHRGPAPVGGVGGARAGVKCLHAHLAWWLAGGPDPVGAWTARRLGLAEDPARAARCEVGHSPLEDCTR